VSHRHRVNLLEREAGSLARSLANKRYATTTTDAGRTAATLVLVVLLVVSPGGTAH